MAGEILSVASSEVCSRSEIRMMTGGGRGCHMRIRLDPFFETMVYK